MMKIGKMLTAAALIATVSFVSCKPKDADVQKNVQEKEATGIMVEVKDGVATLTGEVADDAAKAKAEEIAKENKDVKSVVNNITIAAPVATTPAVTTPVIAVDDVLTKGVMDATKDFSTVKAEVKDGIVWLNGELKKADLPKLMMALNALKPKKIENKLTIK